MSSDHPTPPAIPPTHYPPRQPTLRAEPFAFGKPNARPPLPSRIQRPSLRRTIRYSHWPLRAVSAFAPTLRPICTSNRAGIDLRPASLPITPDKQRKFVAALTVAGIVGQAVRGAFGGLSLRCLSPAGKSMEALYKLRARPGAEGFAGAWDEAVDRGVQRLEDTALARAIEGVPEWKAAPDGGLLIYGMKHDEALVMVLLRGPPPRTLFRAYPPRPPRLRTQPRRSAGLAISGRSRVSAQDRVPCVPSCRPRPRPTQPGASNSRASKP